MGPHVYILFFGGGFYEHGYSGSKVNFYTSKVDSWCRFGRTRVTLEVESGNVAAKVRRKECVSTFMSRCVGHDNDDNLITVIMISIINYQ